MRVAVVGTGHVGLATAVSLASVGHEVVGTDSNEARIDQLQAGNPPFYEPGLQEALTSGLAAGTLRFAHSTPEAVAEAEVVFVCVGTPARASGEANLVAVERAGLEIARSMTGSPVVVEKSTVPAGTAARLKRALQHERPDLEGRVYVASNPEFLREGHALADSLKPHRILVGADDAATFETMRGLYKPLTDQGCPLIETSIVTAELAKHACNAFLALKISYANALARIAERAGADVVEIADVMGLDPRIGRDFLNAGLGYGGYCFPKDLAAFERLSRGLGYEFPLLTEIARINDEAIEAALSKVRDALWNLEEKRIAVLGLAFKANTDDIRLSPALYLASRLIDEGAEVIGYDPQANEAAAAELPALKIADDPYNAVAGAHCVVIAVEWPDFADLDLDRIKQLVAYPVVVDGRNLLDPEKVRAAGLHYYSMGRPSVES
jgi:UDPglucose 6-dehydrogenase